MSSPEQDIDEDPELLALRNELLNGLIKKHTKTDKNDVLSAQTKMNDNNEKSSNLENEMDVTSDNNFDEDENELEMLRAEALNAKRAKNTEAGLLNQNNDNHLKKSNKPGRFRYDKESEDEEDDDDDEDYRYDKKNDKSLEFDQENENNENEKKSTTTIASNNYTDQENSIISQIEYVPTNMSNFNKYNNSYPNFHHNNYQTYRFECSKLMPINAAYEPPNTTTTQTSTNYDLRSFLKSKSSRPQSPPNHGVTTSQQHEQYSPKSLSDHQSNNLEDLDYSLPITQPINISNEIYLSNYQHRINSNNNKRGYLHYNSNNNSFNSYSNESKSNNKVGEDNSKCIDDDDNDKDDDEDEDDDLTYKKMRSVVAKAIISNDKPNNYSYRDSPSSRNYSSRYSPSKSNYNFYRRKHSNSASSK